jgi:hypothetical protein
VIAVAPVERGNDDRVAVEDEAHVTHDASVEDRIERRAVVVPAFAVALDPDAAG